MGRRIYDTFYGTVEKERFGKWLKRIFEEKHVSLESTDQRSVDSLFTVCKLLKINGERGRNRTYNLLIKSQLLCQLSYAPDPDMGTVGVTPHQRGATKRL